MRLSSFYSVSLADVFQSEFSPNWGICEVPFDDLSCVLQKEKKTKLENSNCNNVEEICSSCHWCNTAETAIYIVAVQYIYIHVYICMYICIWNLDECWVIQVPWERHHWVPKRWSKCYSTELIKTVTSSFNQYIYKYIYSLYILLKTAEEDYS